MSKLTQFLCRLLGCHAEDLPNLHLLVGPEEPLKPAGGKDTKMIVEVTKGKRRKVTATPTNKDGTPGKLDGDLAGRLAGGGVATPLITAVVDEPDRQIVRDPLSVWINGVGDVGPTECEIFADARLGPEVREIVVPVTVGVKDQEAENLGLVVGEEVDLPPQA